MNTAISDSVIDTMVKPISPRAFERGLHRTEPLFEMADDVLDDDDRVVDHEADRDRQRHQREIVEAVAELVERRERADQRQRHGDRRE